MNEKELIKSLKEDREYYFCIGQTKYLLYLWDQCDGFILNLCNSESSDCEVIWQSAGRSPDECIEKFKEWCRNEGIQ